MLYLHSCSAVVGKQCSRQCALSHRCEYSSSVAQYHHRQNQAMSNFVSMAATMTVSGAINACSHSRPSSCMLIVHLFALQMSPQFLGTPFPIYRLGRRALFFFLWHTHTFQCSLSIAVYCLDIRRLHHPRCCSLSGHDTHLHSVCLHTVQHWRYVIKFTLDPPSFCLTSLLYGYICCGSSRQQAKKTLSWGWTPNLECCFSIYFIDCACRFHLFLKGKWVSELISHLATTRGCHHHHDQWHRQDWSRHCRAVHLSHMVILSDKYFLLHASIGSDWTPCPRHVWASDCTLACLEFISSLRKTVSIGNWLAAAVGAVQLSACVCVWNVCTLNSGDIRQRWSHWCAVNSNNFLLQLKRHLSICVLCIEQHCCAMSAGHVINLICRIIKRLPLLSVSVCRLVKRVEYYYYYYYSHSSN